MSRFIKFAFGTPRIYFDSCIIYFLEPVAPDLSVELSNKNLSIVMRTGSELNSVWFLSLGYDLTK